MKFSIKKSKVLALFLAMTVAISGLFALPNTAKAAESDPYVTFLNVDGQAVANTPENHAFNIPASTYAAIQIAVLEPVGLNVQITRTSDSTTVYNTTLTADTSYNTGWDYSESNGFYSFLIDWERPTTADYNLTLTFSANAAYMVIGMLSKPAAAISSNSIILTKGFSQKLSVSNATVESWSSSNSKVAAVDKNGKVTAKSTGTATVSAVTTSGETVKCVVTVKANAYSRAKMSFSDAGYGNAYISVTKVSYNKKGDLVIKASFLNNCGHKITEIFNLKLNVKNKSGKTIGTYTTKSKKTSILQGGQKSFTFTIKKAKLKQKSTQDLRQATVKPSWKYRYQLR